MLQEDLACLHSSLVCMSRSVAPFPSSHVLHLLLWNRPLDHPPTQVSVMLVSLKAASLGLNLIAASHVVLLDLWWNPATEEQAIDRAHRIGQTRPVHVARFTVTDTIEDRILELQVGLKNIDHGRSVWCMRVFRFFKTMDSPGITCTRCLCAGEEEDSGKQCLWRRF